MKELMHTPGPWAIGRKPNAMGVVLGGPVREMHTGVLAGSQIAAACLAEWMVPGEREANTALIAAAPDLLAALNDARDYLGGLADGGPVLLGLICIIDDALAKAEGGVA